MIAGFRLIYLATCCTWYHNWATICATICGIGLVHKWHKPQKCSGIPYKLTTRHGWWVSFVGCESSLDEGLILGVLYTFQTYSASVEFEGGGPRQCSAVLTRPASSPVCSNIIAACSACNGRNKRQGNLWVFTAERSQPSEPPSSTRRGSIGFAVVHLQGFNDEPIWVGKPLCSMVSRAKVAFLSIQ